MFFAVSINLDRNFIFLRPRLFEFEEKQEQYRVIFLFDFYIFITYKIDQCKEYLSHIFQKMFRFIYIGDVSVFQNQIKNKNKICPYSPVVVQNAYTGGAAHALLKIFCFDPNYILCLTIHSEKHLPQV